MVVVVVGGGGGRLQNGMGASQGLPLQKRREAEKVLVLLKGGGGGGYIKFEIVFNTSHLSFSHTEGGVQ